MILAALLTYAPLAAQAGNVGWNVSVGGGYGGWRPAAGPYVGPGWGLVGGEVGHITAFTVRILVTCATRGLRSATGSYLCSTGHNSWC